MFTAKGLFKAGGVLLALATSYWPIYKYSLNEDSIQTEYKTFYSSKQRINPAFTVCFNRATFHKFSQSYQNRMGIDLKQQIFSEQSTLRITDFIKIIEITDLSNKRIRLTESGVKVHFNAETEDIDLSLNTILRRYRATSCFAIGLSFANKNGMRSMDIGIKKDIFALGTIPSRNRLIHGKSQLSIGLSFGTQYFPLMSRSLAKLDAHDSSHNVCSGLIFKVRGMEIVSRRNKPGNPCTDYGAHDASKLLHDSVPELECMPLGWDDDSIQPVCQATQLNASVRRRLNKGLYDSNAKTLIAPCTSIVDMSYDDFDNVMDACTDEKDLLHLKVDYSDLNYKETKFVRQYDFWNFVEDITLVIGIFLGISWQQLPDLMTYLPKNKRNKIRVSDKIKNNEEKIQTLTLEIDISKKKIAALEYTAQLQKRGYVTDV